MFAKCLGNTETYENNWSLHMSWEMDDGRVGISIHSQRVFANGLNGNLKSEDL